MIHRWLKRFFNNALALMLTASVSIALAQFFFKLAANQAITTRQAIWLSPAAWVGMAIYALSFPITLQSYKLVALSKVFPLLSLSLVWSASLAVLFLGETISGLRLAGVGLILGGAVLIGRETAQDA